MSSSRKVENPPPRKPEGLLLKCSAPASFHGPGLAGLAVARLLVREPSLPVDAGWRAGLKPATGKFGNWAGSNLPESTLPPPVKGVSRQPLLVP